MFWQINKSKNKDLLAKVIVTGFALNLAWEIIQSPLYIMAFGSRINLLSLVFATLGDALYTGLVFWLFSDRLHKQYIWPLLIITGIFAAILVEKIALIFGIWRYAKNMPIIPAIHTGLTPTIQLALTSVATLLILLIFSKWSQKNYGQEKI